MSKSPGQEPAPGVTSENPEVGGTKARPKITFINPSEFFDIDRNPSENPPTAPNVDLYSRLLGRQVKAAQVQESVLSTENVDTKPRKRRQREKNNKQKHKKRSVDPKFPWLESDDEVDCALPLDDESDDDAFLQRLVEEKEREEAEEERRKQEAARLRQLKAAQRRARFTGRIGRPRGSSMISRVYIPPIDEHPSSRPSETSDDERVSSVNTGEDDPLDLDDAERLSAQRLELDEIPTHSAENEDSEMGSSVALQSSDEHSDLFAATMDPVTLRHCAPCLTLPPSSTDLLCPTEYLLDVLSIYECLRRYSRLLRLSPFRLEDFLSALAANENSALLAEVHIALLKALVQEDEANGTQLCAPDCKDVLSLTFAFLLDRYTWPHILAAYLLSIKKGEPAALASVERLASLSASAATAAGGNPYGGPSCGGGADVVLTAALFEEDLIPLDQAYPFVDIRQRVGILRGLVGLFLATGPVRGDMLNEGFTAHDDFCRVCRQSGEVLCCDTCPAVFHLICLTPPLEAVPSSSWNCPICQAELAAYGEPAIPKSGGHHRTVPIGTDRAGRVYWHVANRIVVEPVDFRQKEPCLPGLLEGVWEDWETAEATAEPVDSEDRCTPHVAYANEPKAYYYSGPADINALRQCLSAQWEPLLCLRLDQLIPTVTGKTTDQLATEFAKSELKSEESTVATLPHLPRGRSILGPSQAVAKPELLAARTPPVAWPPPPVLPPPVDREALEAWLLSASFSELPPMERTFIFEVANGILIHNQDGIFSEFSHSPEDYKNRFKETAPSLVFPPHLVDPSTYESISAAYPHWRGYTNLHSTGLLVPNKAAADSDAQECRVNIILNRLQQHDERERRRLLSNKFSLSDASLGAWAWLEPANVAAMLDRLMDHADNESEEEEVEQEMAETEAGKNKKTKAVTIESLEARARTKQCAAIAVGPKRYLHVLRLTLCYLEAQLPAASLSPAWRLWRQDWHRAVLAADSVAQLADLMSRLETAVRSVAFQRTWSGSLGPLCLERFTAVQREEDKRVRLLERSTGPTGGGNNNHIVRTKTPRPIRHTVWKTRGEEYRRLGGDGWIWLSVTRRRAAMKVRLPLTAAGHASRGPLHGIGWGVCPEYIQNETPIPAEEDISATAVGFHPITGVPLSKNWTRVRYLIPTEALKRVNTEREVAKKGDLTTPTDGVEPDKFEKCVEGEPPKPEPMEVQAEVPQEATVRSPAASREPPLPPKVKIPSTETDLTSSSTMQVVDEESKMEEDDQQVDEKKQKLKKEIEKPEDAEPLVFDVSQGLRERIHFPPVASTRACTDGRKRLCLDDLLTLRRQVAVEAEKVSAEAETGLRELRAQRDKLKAQLAELQARVQTLADQVQNARTEHARAVKAKQTAQAQLSGQSGVYASSMSTTHFDLPFGMNASDSRYQTMSRGRSGGRRQRGRRPGRPPGRLPKMHDPESESKSSTDTDGGTGTHGDDGSSSPAAGGGGGGASTTENSQGLRRSARAQKAPRLDPDFVVDFDDEEADEDDEVDEAEDENAGGSNYEAREADIRFSSLPLLHLDSGGHQQGERAPQSGVQRVILPRLSQLDGADDSSAEEEEEEEAAAATSAIKQGALQKPAQPCSVILTKVPVTNLTSGARPMPSSGLIVSAPLTPGVTKAGQPLIKLQNIGKPLTPITLAQSNLNGISASQAPAVTSTASVDGAPGSQQPVRLVRVLRAPAGSPSGAQLIQTVDAKQPSVVVSRPSNVLLPPSTDSTVRNSIVQLSSSGGVYVTQSSTAPRSYRFLTPSDSPIAVTTAAATTATTSSLNIVRVAMSTQEVNKAGQYIRPATQKITFSAAPTFTAASSASFRAQTIPRMQPVPATPPGLVAIAPARPSTPSTGVQLIRPLVNCAPHPIIAAGGTTPTRRIVRVAQQPATIDPSLEQAVATTAVNLYNLDIQLVGLRSQVKELERQLTDINNQIAEKELLTHGAASASPAEPFSLTVAMSRLLGSRGRLNLLRPEYKTLLSSTVQKARKDAACGRFLLLPKQLPHVNPYAWPPAPLSLLGLSDYTRQSDEAKEGKDQSRESLFRLHRSNLRSVILAAGRREIPGYDVEKKRLVQIAWAYPSSRPSLAEVWRFHLRQLILPHAAAAAAAPGPPGLALSQLALSLRLLWHCLRWDDLILDAEAADDSQLDAFDRYCFREGGGTNPSDPTYTLRRVTAIQPVDKFWLRANFLVKISVHRPSNGGGGGGGGNSRRGGRRKRTAGDGGFRRVASSSSRLSALAAVSDAVTPRSSRRGGRSKKDPDYDPAVDEGWRVGIPGLTRSARRQAARNRRNYRYLSDDEGDDDGGGGGGTDAEDDADALDSDSADGHHCAMEREEWVSEEGLKLWEIRNFLDLLIPVNADYPPPIPSQTLSLLSSLAAPILSGEAETEGEGSWVQPARLPSPEPPRPTTPPVPAPPPLPIPALPLETATLPKPRFVSLPPIGTAAPVSAAATVVTLGLQPPASQTTLLASQLAQPNLVVPAPIAPASSSTTPAPTAMPPVMSAVTKTTSQPMFRPLIVTSSNVRPVVPLSSLASNPVGRPLINFANEELSQRTAATTPRGRRRGPPLSPTTEAARARARSLAASHAARASALMRRLRNERVTLEARVNSLADSLEHRRRLTAKLLALQVEDEILKIKAQKEAAVEAAAAATRRPPGRPPAKPTVDDTFESDGRPASSTAARIPSTGTPTLTSPAPGSLRAILPRKRGRPSLRSRGLTRATPQQLRRRHSSEEEDDEDGEVEEEEEGEEEEDQKVRESRTSRGRRRTDNDSSTPSTTPCCESDEDIIMPQLPPPATMLDLEEALRKESMKGSITPRSARGRRPGRPRGSHLNRDLKQPPLTLSSGIERGAGGRGRRGAFSLRGTSSVSTRGRIPIRPPSYLLDKENDSPDSDEADADDGKLYCVCKTPYDSKQEYIGCDLCQDWFHFTCVGLKPGSAADLGDSWHCPDCKRDENTASQEVYCLCRTPYDTARVYIACDKCDEWYHAECVGMKPEAAANHEGAYICPSCISKQQPQDQTHKAESVLSAKRSPSSAGSHLADDDGGGGGGGGRTLRTIYETKLDDRLSEAISQLLADLKSHKLSWPFMKRPPSSVLESKRLQLKEPIDLPRLIADFKAGVYHSLGDFSFAGNQLFSNARLLHPKDSNEFYCTDVLEAFFLHRMKEIRGLVNQ